MTDRLKYPDSTDFSELNSTQYRIVTSDNKVVKVVAGPGTGKTKTLTQKIAYLVLHKKINPQCILAITFTNRAAHEMKKRLEKQLRTLPTITTFHGLGFEILTHWGEQCNIVGEDERETIIKVLAKERKSTIPASKLSSIISLYKNDKRLLNVTEEIERLAGYYDEKLAAQGYVDFDDLVKKTVEILEKDAEKRAQVQKKYQYILVDEFQDCNLMQHTLLTLLFNYKNNLLVIGDPMQSIYGFRGAYPQIFDKLIHEFESVQKEQLTTNYRSSKQIVKIADIVRNDNTSHSTYSHISGNVELVETLNEYSEAEWVVRFIENKIGGSELLNAQTVTHTDSADFSDFAIIYRTHKTAHILQEKLSESGFPYQVVKEDTELEGDRITLASMHAVKGLEFLYVVICGFEDGLIPYLKKTPPIYENYNLHEAIEEEKRLFYVAITRAKHELYITHARKREKKTRQISRFYQIIQSTHIAESIDQAIPHIIKKQQKRALKKAQQSLF